MHSLSNSFPSPGRLLVTALAMAPLTAVSAHTLESASFGENDKIAPDGSLKNWLLSGKDFTPEIMSDRIIVTPPYPGHKQGAIWAEKKLNVHEWLVDFEFRVNGPEHGQGQLQLWYTKENQAQIGTHNLYSVGKFTGLALLIDQLGGRGGGIRAFLNDGQTDYSRNEIEQLPFGHCDYSYRNLGQPSKLQLHQDGSGVEVLIDGRRCFKAENVFLPQDNYFGITANTGETPDSFEVFKFVTQTGVAVTREEPIKGQEMGSAPNQAGSGEQKVMGNSPPSTGGTDSPMLMNIHSHVIEMGNQLPNAVEEIKRKIESQQSQCVSREEIRSLESKIDRITQLVEKISNEQRDWSGHFREIQNDLKSGTNLFLDKIPESMGNAITTHGPNMMQIVFMLIAAQLLMGLGYILYKRRESTPKKYL